MRTFTRRLLTGALLAGAMTMTSLTAEAIDYTNWMSELPDDAYVAQLSIPGTHDSATGHGTSFDSMAKTQELTLDQQLEIGIRAFDFRPQVKSNTLEAHHGIVNCNITFDDAMKTVIGPSSTAIPMNL